MVLDPGVKVKSIEGDAALADRDLGEARAHLGVEAVAVHAEVGGCIPEPDETRLHTHRDVLRGLLAAAPHAAR